MMFFTMQSVRNLTVRHAQNPVAKCAHGAGLLGLFSLVLLSAVGHCSVSVMPMEAKLTMPADGGRLADDIEIFNSGSTPTHVTASVMDWTMTEAGDPQFSEPGTQPRSCAAWIQLNPMSFSVPPGKSVRVRYSIAPRAIAEEHWAMVFFQTRPVPVKASGLGINISTRVGCKIFITPAKPLLHQGKITDMDLQRIPELEIRAAAQRIARAKAKADRAKLAAMAPSLQDTGEASIVKTDLLLTAEGLPEPVAQPEPAAQPGATTKVKVVFENTSPMNIRLGGTVEARGEDGQVVASGKLPARTQILSGARRELWAQLDKPLPPGAYLIKAIIDYGAKELMSGELKARITLPVAPAITPVSAPGAVSGTPTMSGASITN